MTYTASPVSLPIWPSRRAERCTSSARWAAQRQNQTSGYNLRSPGRQWSNWSSFREEEIREQYVFDYLDGDHLGGNRSDGDHLGGDRSDGELY